MAMIPKSTIQTAVGLLVIGIAMVITLMVFAFRTLNTANGGANDGQPGLTPFPTPTPDLQYYPVPDDPADPVQPE